MITSVIIIASLGIFGFKPVNTASITYEPIKITVNKNYYAQPEFEGRAESIYSKPRMNLPPGYIPSYIKSLISSIKQKTKLCSKETSELVDKEVSEILKPLANPLADFTSGTRPGIVSRKETIIEIIKLLEGLLAELVAVPEEDKIIEIVKPTLIIEKNLELSPPPPVPIIIKDELNPITPDLSVSQDVLAEEINKETLFMENSLEISSDIQKISTDQVSDSSIILEDIPTLPSFLPMSIIFNDEPIAAFPEYVATIPEIPVLSLDKQENIEETLLLKESMKEDMSPPQLIPILINDEPYPITSKVGIIPEAPTLAPLSLEMIPSFAKEVKIEKQVPLEAAEVSPQIEVYSTVVLPNTYSESEKIPPPPPPLPIKMNNEPNVDTSEVVIIPEAPVLPPLSLDFRTSIAEEIKNKESALIRGEESDESRAIQEISPILLPNISIELEGIPPPQPTLPISIKLNNDELNPVTSEIVTIPEAPVLPPLKLNAIPFVSEEKKIKEPLLLEDSEVSRTVQEISPILLSENSIELEEMTPLQPLLPIPIIINEEPNPVTSEVVTIPEAPVLLPLSLDIIPLIAEEVNIKEPLLLEDSEVSHTVQEVSPILLPDNSKELEEMTPPQPLLPIPIIINDEPNPVTSEVVTIPEAPVLPPLSLDIIPPIAEEVNIKERLLLEDSEVSRTIQEISPILLPDTSIELEEIMPPQPSSPISIKINDEPNPVTSEVVTIPEAPVLPPLSLDIIPPIAEEVKIKEPLLVEDLKLSRPIHEMSPILLAGSVERKVMTPPQRPLPISIKMNDKANLVTSEAPFLPPQSLDIIPSIVEEVKNEDLIFGNLKEISSTPILKPIPKITNSEVLKQVLQVRPCHNCLTSPKKRLIPSILSDPRKRLRIFTDAPFLSHLSTGLPKRKAHKNITPNLTSQEPYLIQRIKTNPRYRLSQAFNPHTVIMNRFDSNNKFLPCTSCALNFNRKRIPTNFASIKKSPKSLKKYIPNKRISFSK